MVSGFLLFGVGGFLVYCRLQKLAVAIGKLPDLYKGINHAVNIQTHGLHKQNHTLDTLNGKLAAVSELVR